MRIGIAHRPTGPNHRWTDGQVGRMNRAVQDATLQRYPCATDHQLRAHLADFMAADTRARRPKALSGLTTYGNICKVRTSEPRGPLHGSVVDPIRQMNGSNALLCSRCARRPHGCR